MPIRKPHERPEKILIAMFELSKGASRSLKYEDIVVRAFERFPDEFALRGYPKYPDSSDIHKPLYGPLKRDGLVRSANKTFALTPRGVETAKRLVGANGHAQEPDALPDRMTRDIEAEVARMFKSAAFRLFGNGHASRILDTDFYAFLGCTVRTPRNEFLGRLASSGEAVKEAARLKQPSEEQARMLAELWSLLQDKYEALIERRQGTR